MWREGRSGLTLGVVSAACWLASFVGFIYGGGLIVLLGSVLLLLAGIVLSPFAFVASISGLWKARRGGRERVWPPLVGLVLSLPPAAFVTYALVVALVRD